MQLITANYRKIRVTNTNVKINVIDELNFHSRNFCKKY